MLKYYTKDGDAFQYYYKPEYYHFEYNPKSGLLYNIMINKKKFHDLTFDIGKDITFPCTLKNMIRITKGFNFTASFFEYELDTYITKKKEEKSVFTPIVVHNE